LLRLLYLLASVGQSDRGLVVAYSKPVWKTVVGINEMARCFHDAVVARKHKKD
jgi:hypothetical protein